MNIVLNLILALQILSALAMIGLILMQHGKGADMGAAFGSGGAGSLFGASGSANFLSRSTAVLAAVFFVCTLALAYFGNARPVDSGSVLDHAAPVAIPPATPPAAAPAPAVETGPAAQIPGNGPAPVPAAGASAVPAPVVVPPPATPASPPASAPPAARP